MIAVLIAAVVTGLASLGGVSLFRRRAVRWGLLDVPNDRSLHSTPVPRGGGVVIGTMVIAAVVFLAAVGKAGPPRFAAAYGAAALAVLILGWMDDRWSLSAGVRLAVQLVVAVAAAVAFGWHGASSVVTVIWIVGLINAYNFMDGIDGLAAGQAVVTAGCWIAVGLLLASPFTVAVGAVIAAGSAAFLVHNWSPARVFLGDAGSNFLGLSFAILPLGIGADAAANRLPVAAVLLVGVFLIDTVFTFARRLAARENVLRAHRTHLYQRLIACGYSHAAVAAWWLVLGAVSGAAGLIYLTGASDLGTAMTAAAVAAAMFGSVYIAEARFSAGIVNRS